MSGEFEGFVEMVKKEMYEKFGRIVEKEVVLMKEINWKKGFEKEKFMMKDLK